MLTIVDNEAGTGKLSTWRWHGRILSVLGLLFGMLVLIWAGLGQAVATANDFQWAGAQPSAIPNGGDTRGQVGVNPQHKANGPLDCSSWALVPSSDASSAGNDLYAIAALSANDVWAVGLYLHTSDLTHTLIEHWDGSAWTIVSSPNVGTGSNVLYDISAVSAGDIWAVGYYSESYGGAPIHALIERWDGSAWNVVPSADPQSGYYLEGVVVVSANNVWAVGNHYSSTTGPQSTLIEHWDGTAWSIVPSPNFGSGDDNLLRQIAAVSANDIWAMGNYYDPNVGRTLFEHWDGSAWTVVASPNIGSGDNLLHGITAVSANDVWAVGEYTEASNAPTRTLTEHWNGTAWSIIPSPNFGSDGNRLAGVAAVSASDVWAVGSDSILDAYGNHRGYTLTAHWDGSTWTAVPSPNPDGYGSNLEGVAAVSSSDVWAVGEYSGEAAANFTIAEHYLTSCPTSTPGPTQTPGGPTATPTLPATCTTHFSDVPSGSTFYPYVECLACRGIISGYPNGTFQPGSNVTRGQLSKIIANAVGFQDDPFEQTFADVPVGSPFFGFIEFLNALGIVAGYPCGGVGEPCDQENRPYFRPSANATRSQISKIDALAGKIDMGWTIANPPDAAFEDVVVGSTFYQYIETTALYGVAAGYPCGGAGEPCDAQHRPYFRPNSNTTRGQISKIVSNTFFPQCSTR